MTQLNIGTKFLICTLGGLLLFSLNPAAHAQETDEEQAARQDLEERQNIEEIIVSATRMSRSEKSIPNKVTLIDTAQIDLQTPMTLNPSDLLSNLLPSWSPPRQKLDGRGESFRGRSPLFLIDGVPQSNPLRDGSRDGFTIDMGVVEEIEVIHGANAIQGLGATGGIVNFITVKPPASGELEQRAKFGATVDDGFNSDSTGYRAQYLVGKRWGNWDAVASLTYETRGMQYDGDDRLIGIETAQGDVVDSTAHNFFLKVGFEPGEDQRIQVMLNNFDVEGDQDFIRVDGDRATGLPTSAVRGEGPGEPYQNDVVTLSANYANTNFLGGRFTGQAYFQDFAATYGGGTFGLFQDPLIAPIGELFEQSQNNSEKVGVRLTQRYSEVGGSPVDLIFGIDWLEDETRQTLIHSGRNWVPLTTFENLAPFFQLDFPVGDKLSFTGGARFESAELNTPTYETIAGNRRASDFARVTVDGGNPDFDETLLNFGAVLNPVDDWSIYGTFSEGFTMPDVGRVLRAVDQFGTDVDTFLDLAPLVTENIELGIEHTANWGDIQLAWYESSTDFGVRLVPNEDLIFVVNREKSVVEGWELSFNVNATEWLDLGASYSDLTGEFDSDDDGSVDSDLDANNLSPDRLSVYFDVLPMGRWSGRLQVFRFFDKTFRNAAGATTAEFDGYTVVDAMASTQVRDVTLTFGVANLFDETYITYFGQAGNTRNDRFYAGRGRTLSVTAALDF